MTRVWAVVPAKGFDRAKTRLAPVLDARARAELARSLLAHVIAALRSVRGIEGVLVVTDGDDVARFAAELGVEVVRDPTPGGERPALAAAVDVGLQEVAGRGATAALVCMADLPRATAGELDRVLGSLSRAAVVVVADHRGGGTSVLAVRLPLPFRTSFGHADSAARHRRDAAQRGLVCEDLASPALAFDVDTPVDYAHG